MSRRVVGVALGTSALLGALPSYAATTPPPQMPMATCDGRVSDGGGDGIPVLNPANVNPVPTVGDPRGNVTGLDIKSITFRVTDSRVFAFLGLADVPDALRDTDSAYGYSLWLRREGKFARFDNLYTNPTHVQNGLAPATGYPTVSVGNSSTGGPALTGVAGGIDKAKNVVWVSIDRAVLEAQLGAFVDGEEVSAISGRTELWETDGKTAPGVVRRPADTAEDVAADKAVWTVGDDHCFTPSPIAVSSATVQYGDAATLTATLTDEAGAPMADRQVTFTVPGESKPRTLTTDADGEVRVALDAAPPAGTYTVRVTYAGDEFTGPGLGTGKLTVRTETVRIAGLAVKRSATTRAVTATLSEDDPRAFARQPVAWYVNGKKVATIATDASGHSVFKGAKPGQKVQARYAGASGRYAAATSNTVTA
jgi:hypothetical protein